MASPTATLGYFAEYDAPLGVLSGPLSAGEAGARHKKKVAYCVHLPESGRLLQVVMGYRTVYVHSIARLGDGSEPRPSLSALTYHAGKTRRYRLNGVLIAPTSEGGCADEYIFVEVPPWSGDVHARRGVAGRRQVVAVPEDLREVPKPEFGVWDPWVALPYDPRTWLDLGVLDEPLGFDTIEELTAALHTLAGALGELGAAELGRELEAALHDGGLPGEVWGATRQQVQRVLALESLDDATRRLAEQCLTSVQRVLPR
jgi:hypothetical protein